MTEGECTLTYSPFLGQVSLLRAHDIPVEPPEEPGLSADRAPTTAPSQTTGRDWSAQTPDSTPSPAGEAGPASLLSPGRSRVPRHQDKSATLAGAYPFVAEGGLGSDGVFVGQDLYSGGSFVHDPWVLYA